MKLASAFDRALLPSLESLYRDACPLLLELQVTRSAVTFAQQRGADAPSRAGRFPPEPARIVAVPRGSPADASYSHPASTLELQLAAHGVECRGQWTDALPRPIEQRCVRDLRASI